MNIQRHNGKNCWKNEVDSFNNFEVIIEKPPWRARKTAYLSDKKASSFKNLGGIPKKLGTWLPT